MEEAPRVKQQGVAPQMVKTSLLDDNSVTNAKIKSITFDKAQGGQLTLGGTNNVSGTFRLNNGSGTKVVTMDNTGIQVFNGQISIQNDSSGISLDSKGIVSNSNNFLTTLTTRAALNQVFSTTSYVDVTFSTATFSSITRTCTVLFLMETNAHLTESAGNTADAQISLNVDGSTSNTCNVNLFSNNDYTTTRMSYAILSLAGGSHTVKMQGKLITIYAGAPTMTLVDYSWSYLVLGT